MSELVEEEEGSSSSHLDPVVYQEYALLSEL